MLNNYNATNLSKWKIENYNMMSRKHPFAIEFLEINYLYKTAFHDMYFRVSDRRLNLEGIQIQYDYE